MSELDSPREAVEAGHGSKADFFEQTPIREVLRGRTVWEGSVMTFAAYRGGAELGTVAERGLGGRLVVR